MDNGNLAFLFGVGLGAVAGVLTVALFGFSNFAIFLLTVFTFGGVFLGHYLEKVVERRYQQFKENLIKELTQKDEN